MASAASRVLDRLFGAAEPSADDPTSSASASASAVDVAALKAQARKARRGTSKSEQAVIDAAQQADLDQLFEEENWEVLAGLYFECRFAMTGFEYFRLTDKQQRILGRTLGASMRVLLRIDPKYVALVVFLTNFGAFVTDKELAYRRAVKDWEAKQAAATGNGSQRAA